MAIIPTHSLLTPEELAAHPDEIQFELIDGELVERSMSFLSCWVGLEIARLLANHCRANRLGWVFPADLGYQCFPDDPNRMRRADASFIRAGRFPGGILPTRGFSKLVPDLVVEVLSPNDLAVDVELKVKHHLGAGVRLLWIITPETLAVRIHRADRTVGSLSENDELDGEDVVPEFRCRVADLFLSPETGEPLQTSE